MSKKGVAKISILAIIALVLGILSVLLGWVPILGWVIIVATFIMGFLAIKKGVGTKMATASIIMGFVGVVGMVIFFSVALNTADADYSLLLEENNELGSDYDTLFQENLNLQTQNDILAAGKAEVEEESEALREFSEKQSEQAANLIETLGDSIQPPFININARIVTFAFRRLNGDLETWEFPFDSFEQSFQEGDYYRETAPIFADVLWNVYQNEKGECDYMKDIGLAYDCDPNVVFSRDEYEEFWDENKIPSLQLKSGLRVGDFRGFVEPELFEEVIKPIYAESASDEEFVKEVFNIVRQGPTYVSDIGETPRYSLETLTGAGGDCEDSAILIASLLLAANRNWKVQFVVMDADNPYGINGQLPNTINHIAVFVDTGKFSTFIESTSKVRMNSHTQDVVGWYFDIL